MAGDLLEAPVCLHILAAGESPAHKIPLLLLLLLLCVDLAETLLGKYVLLLRAAMVVSRSSCRVPRASLAGATIIEVKSGFVAFPPGRGTSAIPMGAAGGAEVEGDAYTSAIVAVWC